MSALQAALDAIEVFVTSRWVAVVLSIEIAVVCWLVMGIRQSRLIIKQVEGASRYDALSRRLDEISRWNVHAGNGDDSDAESDSTADSSIDSAPGFERGATAAGRVRVDPRLVDRLLADLPKRTALADVLRSVRAGLRECIDRRKLGPIDNPGPRPPDNAQANAQKVFGRLSGIILAAVRGALPSSHLPPVRLYDRHYCNRPDFIPPHEAFVAGSSVLTVESQITVHTLKKTKRAAGTSIAQAAAYAAQGAAHLLSTVAREDAWRLDGAPIRTTGVYSDGEMAAVVEVRVTSQDVTVARTELVPLFAGADDDAGAWTEAALRDNKNGAGLIALNLLAACARFDAWSRKTGWICSLRVPGARISAAEDSLQLMGRGGSADVYAVRGGLSSPSNGWVVKVIRDAADPDLRCKLTRCLQKEAEALCTLVRFRRPCSHVPQLLTKPGNGLADADADVEARCTTRNGREFTTRALLIQPLGTPLVQCLDDIRHCQPASLVTLDFMRAFVAAVLLGVGSALAHGYAAGVLHDDVRLANVVLAGWNKDGMPLSISISSMCSKVVLVDWGVTDPDPYCIGMIRDRLRSIAKGLREALLLHAGGNSDAWPEETRTFLKRLGRAKDRSTYASEGDGCIDIDSVFSSVARMVRKICGLSGDQHLQAVAAAAGCTCFGTAVAEPAHRNHRLPGAGAVPRKRQRAGSVK